MRLTYKIRSMWYNISVPQIVVSAICAIICHYSNKGKLLKGDYCLLFYGMVMDSNMELVMAIKNVKSISEFAFRFPLEKGLYAITGENASGKSTIVACASTVFFMLLCILDC